jgi:hypothetical protein
VGIVGGGLLAGVFDSLLAGLAKLEGEPLRLGFLTSTFSTTRGSEIGCLREYKYQRYLVFCFSSEGTVSGLRQY